MGIHGGIAMLSGRMEWSLDTSERAFDGKTEAEFLAQSISDVSRHYGGDLLDQKTVDWLNLLQALALIYGGRLIAIRMSPQEKPPRRPTVQETAREHRAAPPPQMQQPVSFGTNDAPAANVGEVPGIGEIQFPDDHPLSPNFKPRVN